MPASTKRKREEEGPPAAILYEKYNTEVLFAISNMDLEPEVDQTVRAIKEAIKDARGAEAWSMALKTTGCTIVAATPAGPLAGFEKDPQGNFLEVAITGDGQGATLAVFLDFDDLIIRVFLGGSIDMEIDGTEIFSLSGEFLLEIKRTHFQILALGSLSVGGGILTFSPDGSLLAATAGQILDIDA